MWRSFGKIASPTSSSAHVWRWTAPRPAQQQARNKSDETASGTRYHVPGTAVVAAIATKRLLLADKLFGTIGNCCRFAVVVVVVVIVVVGGDGGGGGGVITSTLLVLQSRFWDKLLGISVMRPRKRDDAFYDSRTTFPLLIKYFLNDGAS